MKDRKRQRQKDDVRYWNNKCKCQDYPSDWEIDVIREMCERESKCKESDH